MHRSTDQGQTAPVAVAAAPDTAAVAGSVAAPAQLAPDVRTVAVAQSSPLRLPASAGFALGLLCAVALLGLVALRPRRRRP